MKLLQTKEKYSFSWRKGDSARKSLINKSKTTDLSCHWT